MNKIIKPLQPYYPIIYFSYQRVDQDGKYAFIANRPDYIDFYMQNKFYDLDPYLIHPQNYPEGTHTVFVNPEIFSSLDDKIAKLVKECNQFFNFHQTVLITQKSGRVYETFCFSGKFEDSSQTYFKEADLFKNFIPYFKENLPIDFQIDGFNQGMDLAAAKGKSFDLRRDLFNKTVLDPQERKNSVLKAVNEEHFKIQKGIASLTPRERECLKWMVMGKTALETGLILSISKRTVDTHIENAIGKLEIFGNRAKVAYLLGKYELI